MQGLKINNLNKFKTFGDFKKLNIPVQQTTKELLNKKPTRTWTINPRKLTYGSLKFEKLMWGTITPTSWRYGSGSFRRINEHVERLNRGRNVSSNNTADVFTLKIKFRASGASEYRLKLKEIDHMSHENYRDKYIYVRRISKNGLFISRLNMNELEEYNYIFKEPNSCDINLEFTGAPNLGRVDWELVTISEIRIDKIN